MTVTLAWSGTATAGHVVSPTTVEFAVGSDNALVTPTFAPGPVSGGDLTLTLVSGPGYQLGTPSAATTQFAIAQPLCIPDPPLVNPGFTG